MSRLAIAFWSAFLVSGAWCAKTAIDTAVILGAYNPMAAPGDLLFPLRVGVALVPILTALVLLGLWIRQRPLPAKTYIIGLVVLAAADLVPVLPKVDSGYRQVYWLGDDRYEIPWIYGPYNGNPEPGGKYFLVKVPTNGMVLMYGTGRDTIIIGKAIDFNHGDGGPPPETPCTQNRNRLECQWQRGSAVYILSAEADLFSPDMTQLTDAAADLLDSFAAPAAQD